LPIAGRSLPLYCGFVVAGAFLAIGIQSVARHHLANLPFPRPALWDLRRRPAFS
jgi:hypothetical protein